MCLRPHSFPETLTQANFARKLQTHPARDYNADTLQERLARLHRVMMPVFHRRSSWVTNFAYGTLASFEENGETFLVVCLHCNQKLNHRYKYHVYYWNHRYKYQVSAMHILRD